MCQPYWVWKGSLISPSFSFAMAAGELGSEDVGALPAEIAALRGGAGVLRGGRGGDREVLALQDALADLLEPLPHGRIVLQLVGLHQDVAHVDLLHDRLLVLRCAPRSA